MSYKNRGLSIQQDKNIIIIISLIYMLFVIFSWGKYGLPFSFDHARELLIPYLINHDLLIYKDFVYFYGPIVPYFLAFLAKIAGFKLTVFHLTGIVITFLYSLLLFRISRYFLDRNLSFIVILLFYVQLAFNDLGAYIFPYTYNALIGSFIYVGIFSFLLKHYKTGNSRLIYYSAGLASCLFLIKQDFFIVALGFFLIYILFESLNKNNHALKSILKILPYRKIIISLSIIFLPPLLFYVFIGFFTGYGNLISGLIPSKLYLSGEAQSYISAETLTGFNLEYIIGFLFHSLVSFLFIAGLILLIYGIIILMTRFVLSKKASDKTTGIIIFLIISVVIYAGHTLIAELFNFIFINYRLIYAGINLWIIVFIVYLIFSKRENTLRNELLLLCLAALIVSFRSFMHMKLNSYPLFSLPLTLIIFVYLMAEILPLLFLHLPLKDREGWKLSAKISLTLITIIYSFIIMFQFHSLKYIIQSPIGNYYCITAFQCRVNNLYIKASEYISEHSLSSDRILAYPNNLLIYIFAERLPASRHYDLYPGTVPDTEEELSIAQDILTSNTKFISISNDVYYFQEERGKFGSEKHHPDLYKWITDHYSPLMTFTEDNSGWNLVILGQKW
jgi:hypothetical protein